MTAGKGRGFAEPWPAAASRGSSCLQRDCAGEVVDWLGRCPAWIEPPLEGRCMRLASRMLAAQDQVSSRVAKAENCNHCCTHQRQTSSQQPAERSHFTASVLAQASALPAGGHQWQGSSRGRSAPQDGRCLFKVANAELQPRLDVCRYLMLLHWLLADDMI